MLGGIQKRCECLANSLYTTSKQSLTLPLHWCEKGVGMDGDLHIIFTFLSLDLVCILFDVSSQPS